MQEKKKITIKCLENWNLYILIVQLDSPARFPKKICILYENVIFYE